VAQGASDARLLAAAAAYNQADWPVWVRPMPEMNGHWSPDCAVTASGASRGEAYSAQWFRRAFQRVAAIVRGGSRLTIDRRPHALGLGPLPASARDVRHRGKVLVMWNPQGQGSPDVAGNRPADYWPGDGSVDIVANDLYSIRFNAYWPGMDALYD